MARVNDPGLVVAEVFGPTVQGEGPSAGRRAGFIRLAGCNLHCSWCDSAFTWDASRYDLRAEAQRRPVLDIVRRALDGNPELVVITGGEPLLHQHQDGWVHMLSLLAGYASIEVETNGTVLPAAETLLLVSRFNVSPKLHSGGDPERKRIVPRVLADLRDSGKAVFKFVCRTAADVHEAAEVARVCGIPPHLVWIMPEGTSAQALARTLADIADPAIDNGFSLTSRLHVLAWGDQRGR